jgi:hypothetical protein
MASTAPRQYPGDPDCFVGTTLRNALVALARANNDEGVVAAALRNHHKR